MSPHLRLIRCETMPITAVLPRLVQAREYIPGRITGHVATHADSKEQPVAAMLDCDVQLLEPLAHAVVTRVQFVVRLCLRAFEIARAADIAAKATIH